MTPETLYHVSTEETQQFISKALLGSKVGEENEEQSLGLILINQSITKSFSTVTFLLKKRNKVVVRNLVQMIHLVMGPDCRSHD